MQASPSPAGWPLPLLCNEAEPSSRIATARALAFPSFNGQDRSQPLKGRLHDSRPFIMMNTFQFIRTTKLTWRFPKITDFDLDRAKYESRISVMTNSQQIIYSIPFWLPQSPDKTYFNLWLQRGNERTRVTDATQQDLEVNTSPDGQWFYFSSDRLSPGRYNIWRVRTVGRGGLTKITDSPSSVVDTEPAVTGGGDRTQYGRSGNGPPPLAQGDMKKAGGFLHRPATDWLGLATVPRFDPSF